MTHTDGVRPEDPLRIETKKRSGHPLIELTASVCKKGFAEKLPRAKSRRADFL
jgi:hypothetical protein